MEARTEKTSFGYNVWLSTGSYFLYAGNYQAETAKEAIAAAVREKEEEETLKA